MTKFQHITDQPMIYHGLLDALDKLDGCDADLKRLRAEHGNPPDRFTPANLSTLIRIILGQQISRAVADSLWKKLTQNSLDMPEHLASSTYEQVHALGLSRRKAEYIVDLARAEQNGTLNLEYLNTVSSEEFTTILSAYRGIGHWTISNYRLFCLGDFDAWPGNDLALMEAVKRLRSLETRPSSAQMDIIAQEWRPFRGAAALLLWHLYAVWVRNASPIS